MAQLHRRSLERAQFAAHPLRRPLLKPRPPVRLSRFAQQKILRLVTEITSHQAKSEFPDWKPSLQRAAFL